jgi:xylulokinase
MDEQASLVPPGANGLIYLPYLMGERTPHLDAYARGVFFGISAKHNKRDFLRSVMEGVVYALTDCLDIIRGMGVEISEVRASGGGGKSNLWRQMQADMFNSTIKCINSSEGPALGAAILAMIGTGEYASVEQACESIISVRDPQIPDEAVHKKYMKFHGVYKRLYTAIKDEYTILNNIK